jgi:hypothetical protein
MKSTLWFSIIIAVFFTASVPVQAFDPGAWLQQRIIELDKRASENMTQRGNARKEFSSGRHQKDSISRIKKCLKAEAGRRSRHEQ